MKEDYFLSGKPEPTNEAYAIAKIAGMKLCEYINDEFNLNFISCMPTNIYGEGDNSEAFKANLQKGVLFPQRLGFQSELASMVVECITNSYMNAETIRVDGGIRMPPK